MPTEKVNEATRREWRKLGFFYDRDDKTKEWLIRGSRAGLLEFSRILLEYSRNPHRQQLSEHDHLGPYMYLKIGTWSARIIDDHWIAGTSDDLAVLSTLITERISKAKEGDMVRLRQAYAPASPYELRLEVCGDEFDPAVADKACW
ncbi:MAG: hypothetical protein EPN75_12485 [Beijerinckiaceae bacterium]|nr:MAG: hypothetical protein EPN75_12485 [Beijerinckiaceae bacterium]